MSQQLIYGRGALCVAALAVLSLPACSREQHAQARGRDDAAKSVSTTKVRQETVTRSIEVVGTLAAVDEVILSSQTEGAVSRILADLGDRVKAGQPLIELDAEKLQYNLEQQKAALARALAKYGGSDPAHLPVIEQTPDVQKAAAELVQAKQAFQRADELHKRQLVPRQTLDDADAMLRAKQASYESALQNARNLRADIDGSSATLKLADREFRDATIRAPFDGFVQKRMVSPGEYVKAQAAVMSIVRLDPLKVTAEIPEGMAPWVAVGQPVDLRVDAFPDTVLHGKMSRISPAVNTQTRAFPFEALVPNGDAKLKPGTFARVRLETSREEQVLTLPYTALQYRYGVNRAFVIKGDRLSAHEVKIGDRIGDRVEILGGVDQSDEVATTDVDNLADGLRVTTKPSKG
jgi:multidrug efflux pump subunit AcrA (membrane-fusion protein)